MDKQQALQEGELGQGVVTALHGLQPLLPADAHPDVCGCGGQMHTGRFEGSFRGS